MIKKTIITYYDVTVMILYIHKDAKSLGGY